MRKTALELRIKLSMVQLNLSVMVLCFRNLCQAITITHSEAPLCRRGPVKFICNQCGRSPGPRHTFVLWLLTLAVDPLMVWNLWYMLRTEMWTPQILTGHCDWTNGEIHGTERVDWQPFKSTLPNLGTIESTVYYIQFFLEVIFSTTRRCLASARPMSSSQLCCFSFFNYKLWHH